MKKRSLKEIEIDLAWLMHERDMCHLDDRTSSTIIKERMFIIGCLIGGLLLEKNGRSSLR